jgi:phenylalanyl-tRNA synthetase beta chain
MNIKLLDSWIREYLDTKATVKQIADALSLSSVSVEKIENLGKDHLLDMEVTTNRPDLMSVMGIAREATAALKASGITAKFLEKKTPKNPLNGGAFPIEVINDPALTNRICAAVLSVRIQDSPQLIKNRLEATDIRSLNNVVDVTNYVMRELGHPIHAFDFDKLSGKLEIREAKKGEKIITLDKKEYVLSGKEIVAVNDRDEIIDLLGIMGTLNSAVDNNTKKILLFIDNNDFHRIRKTSMDLGIRTDAAILNEKGVDPEVAYKAIIRAIELLEQVAGAKVESGILDLYPNKIHPKKIDLTLEKVRQVMGVNISEKQVLDILENLSFVVKMSGKNFLIIPPTNRARDIEIPEDIIEEVARIYGYHKLPSIIPQFGNIMPENFTDVFFWERKTKEALKYWGFTELYTSSLISEDMLEVDPREAVKLLNPLDAELAYMRTALIPSLLQALRTNKSYDLIKIFEMSNVYHKKTGDLPREVLMLGGVINQENNSFFIVKGIIEALFNQFGIKKYEFKKREAGGDGADVYVYGNKLGEIEILDKNIIDFEINFTDLLKYASNKKTYTPVPKFPPAIEDIRIKIDEKIEYSKIISTIKKAGTLVSSASLLDTYQDKKTFRITYQSREKNLTANDIKEIRDKIIHNLKQELRADIV